jgi:osmotically-inducible protein OsmY
MTQEGIVTLEGFVETDPERKTLESIARGVEGVKGVENDLDVAPSNAGV